MKSNTLTFRRLTLSLTVALPVALLAGCGGNQGPSTQADKDAFKGNEDAKAKAGAAMADRMKNGPLSTTRPAGPPPGAPSAPPPPPAPASP